MKLKLLPLFVIPFFGLSLIEEPSFIPAKAQSFDSADWTLAAPNGSNPWTINENSLVNINEAWFPANFLMKNDTQGLNVTDENRLSFQLKTSFHSETSPSTLGGAQWRGFTIFYINDSNWLSAGVKWNVSATTHRSDPMELQEMMVYGRINGGFYQTWGSSSWTTKEWNDLWTDNCGIHLTDAMELTVTYTPALEGSTINADTDLITLTLSTDSKSVSKQQRLRSLSDEGYFDLSNYISTMSAGLYSINDNPSVHNDPVTFTSFEYKAIKPVIADYEKVDQGFVGSQITLPGATASTILESNIIANVSVTDPDGQDVEVESNKFTPAKAGNYTITYSATDKYHTTTTDSYILNVRTGYLIVPNSEPVTSGLLNDVITLPTFSVEDHPDYPTIVNVKDPNGTAVEVTNNSFVAAVEGNYVVRVTSSEPNVAPLQYEINIVDPFVPTYSIVEDGERMVSGVIGDKITIPHYSVQDHEEINLTITVLDPIGQEVILFANSFSATKQGAYKVNVKAETGKWSIEDVNYDIVISNINNDGSSEEVPPANPDPNTYNYAYGKRTAGIYLLIVGVALGVSGLSVGGFFLAKFLMKKKVKKEGIDE